VAPSDDNPPALRKAAPELAAQQDPPQWQRRNRHHRAWNLAPLGERSREDLEALICDIGQLLADRDRHIAELEDQLAEKERKIAELQNDLAWARAQIRQLEGVAAPSSATVVRPDGLSTEILHAVSRESQEISPPVRHGHPDYAAWGKLVVSRVAELGVAELQWLLTDNSPHLDAYEDAYPGAGVGLEDRINARIAEIEEGAKCSTG
jgi:hypothetical protein